jgi:hypothetical protein
MSGQFCMFQKKLVGAATNDKAYRPNSAILDLIPTGFVKPRPNPLVHSKVVVMYEDNGTPTGETRLICYDPIKKEEIDAEYNMDLKIQKSDWNQYE